MRFQTFIFSLLILVSCGGKNGKDGKTMTILVPATTSPQVETQNNLGILIPSFSGTVELKELNSPNQKFIDVGGLDFGEKNRTSSIYNPEKVIKLRNSSDSSVQFSIEIFSEEFFIENSTCPELIPARSSCDLKLRFSGGSRRNGTIKGSIILSNGPKRIITLNLIGRLIIQGNDYDEDDNDDGETSIGIIMEPGPFVIGDNPLREVTISNKGDDPLDNLKINITEGYRVFANGCPTVLEEEESCRVLVFYINYAYLPIEYPRQGFLSITSNMSDNYSLSLTGGDVTSEDD